MALDEQAVVQALQSKGVKGECPRCDHNQWQASDAFTQAGWSDEPWVANFGGSMTPLVVVFCTHCGFASFHHAGALGLAPPSANG